MKILDIIKQDIEFLPQGFSSLPEIAGKQVKSILASGQVSYIATPAKHETKLTTIKKEVLTGEIVKYDNRFVYAKTKSGLWIDSYYIQLDKTPAKKGNNTMLIIIGLIVGAKMFDVI